MDLLKKDFLLFDQLAERGPEKVVLTDTSFIETVVFAARAGIEMGPGVESWVLTKRFVLICIFKANIIFHMLSTVLLAAGCNSYYQCKVHSLCAGVMMNFFIIS